MNLLGKWAYILDANCMELIFLFLGGVVTLHYTEKIPVRTLVLKYLRVTDGEVSNFQIILKTQTFQINMLNFNIC
jgi:hypothetical protein